MRNFKRKFVKFKQDDDGIALDMTLLAAIVSLPLAFFLVSYGQDVVMWAKSKTPNMFTEESHWED